MGVLERQQAVRLYRGQIPSPGRPTVAWRQDPVRFWVGYCGGGDDRGRGGSRGCVVAGWVSVFRHAGGVNPRCQ